ncbi:MAG: fumarate hydratase, partial [Clostridia bacterium]|nr:fumarate hydratase [Clostridia bacterium]
MKEIDVSVISKEVSRLCIEANKILPDDLCSLISDASGNEKAPLAKSVMCDLCENLKAAKELDLPICQDTGMAVIFAKIGQDVHITGGSFEKAVNEGVARGYIDGKLRLSVVSDP